MGGIWAGAVGGFGDDRILFSTGANGIRGSGLPLGPWLGACTDERQKILWATRLFICIIPS